MRRHLVGLVVPLAAFLVFSTPGFAGEAQWVEVKSPHFSIVTDGGEKRGRDVAVSFEQMRAVFVALLVQSNVNLPVPLQIVAFRNTLRSCASSLLSGTGSRRWTNQKLAVNYVETSPGGGEVMSVEVQ